MLRHLILGVVVLVAACAVRPATAVTPPSEPSAAILALRDQFEAEVLAIEGKYADNIAGLQVAALGIAAQVYGQNWAAVRAEAQRSLSALPAIDLAPFATAKPVPNDMQEAEAARLGQFTTRDGLALLRFWDAQQVAFSVGAAAAPIVIGDETAAMVGLKFQLVPPRAYRGTFRGRDVLVMRYYRSLVTIPFTVTADGLIRPDLAGVEVFALTP